MFIIIGFKYNKKMFYIFINKFGNGIKLIYLNWSKLVLYK